MTHFFYMLARAIVAACPKASLEAATDMASYLEVLAEEGVEADDIVSALEAQLDGQGLTAPGAALEDLARQLLSGAFKGGAGQTPVAPPASSAPALLKEAIVCAPVAKASPGSGTGGSAAPAAPPPSAQSASAAALAGPPGGSGTAGKPDEKATLASVVRVAHWWLCGFASHCAVLLLSRPLVIQGGCFSSILFWNSRNIAHADTVGPVLCVPSPPLLLDAGSPRQGTTP